MKILSKINKNRKKIIVSIAALAIIIILFFILQSAGSWLVVKDELQPADAIVVLTGSTGDRMLQTSEIYKKGYADKVLIVNPYTQAQDLLLERGVHLKSQAEISKEIGVERGIPEEHIIILPGDAQSTGDEAATIYSYLAENDHISKIILINSSYHSRRSYAIFNRTLSVLDDPVKIIVVPSQYSDFNADRWYSDRQSSKQVVMEYTRLFYFWVWERWWM